MQRMFKRSHNSMGFLCKVAVDQLSFFELTGNIQEINRSTLTFAAAWAVIDSIFLIIMSRTISVDLFTISCI